MPRTGYFDHLLPPARRGRTGYFDHLLPSEPEEEQGILGRQWKAFLRGLAGAPRAVGDAAMFLGSFSRDPEAAEIAKEVITDPLTAAPQSIAETMYVQPAPTLVGRGVQAALESSPQMAATIASGPAAPVTAFAFAGSASEQEALERGVDPALAKLKGLASGALVAPLETIGARGVGFLLKKMPAAKRAEEVRRLLIAAGKESGTEATQEAVELILEAGTGKDVTLAETLERIPVAAIAGGVTAGGARGLRLGADITNRAIEKAGQPAIGDPGQEGAINAGDIARVGEGLSSKFKRYLTVARGLPSAALEVIEGADSSFQADLYQAMDRADRFARVRDAISKGDEGVATQLTDGLHRYVHDRGYREGEGRELPDEVRAIGEEMRAHIDNRSIALLSYPDLLTKEQRQIVGRVFDEGARRGLGQYMRRTFAIHDDPQAQAKRVGLNLRTGDIDASNPIWQGAQRFLLEDADFRDRVLKNSSGQDAINKVNTSLRALFEDVANQKRHRGPMTSFDLLGRIDRAGLKQRQLLDPRMIDLLGEHKGEVAYVQTIQSMSRLLAKQDLYRGILEGPLFPLLFHETLPNDRDYIRLRESDSPTAQEIISAAAGLPMAGPGRAFTKPGRRVPEKTDIRQWRVPEVEGVITKNSLGKMKKDALSELADELGAIVDTESGKPKKADYVKGIIEELQRRDTKYDELWIHKNLMDALDHGFTHSNPLAAALEQLSAQQPVLGKTLSILVRGSGIAKSSLTVYKPQAQARNFFSNPLAVIASGGIPLNPKEWRDAWRRTAGMAKVQTRFGGKMTKEEAAETEKRTRLGIYSPNVDVGDTEFYVGDITRRYVERGGVGAGILKAMPRSYQFGDNYWKDLGFTSERKKLAKSHPDVDPDALDREAAGLVKGGLQNYNRLPRLIENLRWFPALGPFVAFPTAVAINVKNQIKRGLQEIGGGDIPGARLDPGSILTPGIGKNLEQAKVGARRLGGTLAALTVAPKAAGAVFSGLANIFSPLLDFVAGSEDDEDPEQLQYDYQMAAAPWSRNSRIKVLGKSKTEAGVGYSIDLSFSDYFGSLSKPVIAMMRSGQYDENAFKAAIQEGLSPYYSADVFFGTLMELFTNQDQYGRRIYNPESPYLDSTKKVATHLVLGTLGPADAMWRLVHGLLGEEDLRGREFDAGTELFAQFLGPRIVRTDFGDQVGHKANHAASILQLINKSIRDHLVVPDEIDVDEAQRIARFHHDSVRRVLKEATTMVEVAQRRGVSRERAILTMRNSALPKGLSGPLIAGVDPKLIANRWLLSRYQLVNKHRRTRFAENLRRFRDRNLRGPEAERLEEQRLREVWAPIDLSFFLTGEQ